jgi:hypothetical protein
VFARVGDRFLCNAQKRELDIPRERPRRTGDDEAARQPGAAGRGFGAQRLDQRSGFECRGAEIPDRAARLFERGPRVGLGVRREVET